jgi:hypothetical protein
MRHGRYSAQLTMRPHIVAIVAGSQLHPPNVHSLSGLHRTRSIQLEWPYNFDDSTLLPILGQPSHSIQRPINLSAEEIYARLLERANDTTNQQQDQDETPRPGSGEGTPGQGSQGGEKAASNSDSPNSQSAEEEKQHRPGRRHLDRADSVRSWMQPRNSASRLPKPRKTGGSTRGASLNDSR